MIFLFVKDQIYFVTIKENGFFMTEKSDLFLYFQKYGKDFFLMKRISFIK